MERLKKVEKKGDDGYREQNITGDEAPIYGYFVL